MKERQQEKSPNWSLSLKNIDSITRKAAGDNDAPEESEVELVQNRKLTDKSYYAQSFQMFKEGKSLVDIVLNWI